MASALNNKEMECKPAVSVSDPQSFQSCVKTRMVAANIFAMWSVKMLNAPALVAISWIQITNLVYLMVRLTYISPMQSQGCKLQQNYLCTIFFRDL